MPRLRGAGPVIMPEAEMYPARNAGRLSPTDIKVISTTAEAAVSAVVDPVGDRYRSGAPLPRRQEIVAAEGQPTPGQRSRATGRCGPS
ncbi:MAG TPA: hypothetical protein DDY78_22125 [Planctomycetales bacterium]|jgi:hypothetical protein|nr:hypothetical protein [Planctomycetales bacterium]